MSAPERRDDGQPTQAVADVEQPSDTESPGAGTRAASPAAVPGRGQAGSHGARRVRDMVAESRASHPGAVVRRVVLAGETGVNADEQRIWCAGRASVHLDVAIAQLADLLPCVREMHEEGLEEQVHQAAVYLWNIRERMFEIVEEYDEEPESDE